MRDYQAQPLALATVKERRGRRSVTPGSAGRSLSLAVAASLALTPAAQAQESAPAAAAVDSAAQANNPLANFTAFNVHNYYIGEFSDSGENGNQVWARFATPFSLGETKWLMRASLPLNTYPVPPEMNHETGLGDMNVFAAYLVPMGSRKISVGVGPQITMPTATGNALGSGQWSLGLVHTLFNYASPKFQWGYLLSWQASVAGADDRANVNIGGFQPFLFYQLGKGAYLRSTAVLSYNFEAGTYTVPIGLGIGKVIPTRTKVFNVFIEPQVSVADKGEWPKWQIFIGLNTQFK